MEPPTMKPATAAEKRHQKHLVLSALNRESRGDLPPMPAYYAPKIFSTPPSACMKSIAIRLLAIEAAMYPSAYGLLWMIHDDEYTRRDLDEFWMDVNNAYFNALKMLKGTDEILRKQELLESQNKHKSFGTMRLFHKDLQRFDLKKQLVKQELEKNPNQMPQTSFEFLGIELAKHHKLFTQFQHARALGWRSLRAFLTTRGYATEARFQESMRALNLELDNYYRFHKKYAEEIMEAKLKVKRKHWLELDRGRARSYIMRERLLTNKGKELLLEAVKTDDTFLKKYVRMTTSGTPTWHVDLQTKREGKLVDLMTEYIEQQAEKAAKEAEAEISDEIDEGDNDENSA